jgi:hypothetical protein
LALSAIEKRDVASFVREQIDDRAADASAAAGHDDALAPQSRIDFHRSSTGDREAAVDDERVPLIIAASGKHKR